MKSSVTGGVVAFATSTIITRLAGVAAQLALAFFLSGEEFGLYAIAVGWYSFSNVFRDGGMESLLLQGGAAHHRRLKNAGFWIALAINLAVATLVVALSPLISQMYSSDVVGTLLQLMVLSVVLASPCGVLRSELALQGRYQTIVTVDMISPVTKLALWVGFAAAGFGTLSFGIAMPIVAIIEVVLLVAVTSRLPYHFPSRRSLALVSRRLGWLNASHFLTPLIANGDYLLLGWLVPKATLGVYYFAFELVAQTGVLLANNVQKVLLPALSTDRTRVSTRVVNAAVFLVSGGAYLSLFAVLFVAAFADILGWSSKFPGLLLAVAALSLFFPLRGLLVIPRVLLLVRNRMRQLTFLLAVQALLLLITVAIVGFATDDVALLSLAIGFCLGATSSVITVAVMKVQVLASFSLVRYSGAWWISQLILTSLIIWTIPGAANGDLRSAFGAAVLGAGVIAVGLHATDLLTGGILWQRLRCLTIRHGGGEV